MIKAEVEYLGGILRKFVTLNIFGQNLRNEVKIGEKVSVLHIEAIQNKSKDCFAILITHDLGRS